MAITKQDIELQREQAQEDVRCILDSLNHDPTVDHVCQVIVDRFNTLRDKLED